jgi:hypothetical protein
MKRGAYHFNLAEKQGFEPWDPSQGQRFSRPPQSTTLPSLQCCKIKKKTKKAIRQLQFLSRFLRKVIFYQDKFIFPKIKGRFIPNFVSVNQPLHKLNPTDLPLGGSIPLTLAMSMFKALKRDPGSFEINSKYSENRLLVSPMLHFIKM